MPIKPSYNPAPSVCKIVSDEVVYRIAFYPAIGAYSAYIIHPVKDKPSLMIADHLLLWELA